ncbi:MAG: hypothetical protein JRJ84_18575 [Deltaproteobacteria bacterium]|nr:hypothetical protein [Deltaproteobacteria bacterium]
MNDDQMRQELAFLGIEAESYGLVALLPLVRVAWADGSVQEAERRLITDIATKRGLLEEGGIETLEGWLKEPPSAYYLKRARKVLGELVNRTSGPGSEVDLKTLDETIAFCEGVARSAGGLFGVGSVKKDERLAIEEIVKALGVKRSLGWKDLKGQFR